MEKVKDLKHEPNSKVVQWRCGDKLVIKEYSYPAHSAVMLIGETGVALVEPHECGQDNAVIFNADGTERFRLRFPGDRDRGYWFHEIYYVGRELTAIVHYTIEQLAYVIDPLTGKYIRSYETK